MTTRMSPERNIRRRILLADGHPILRRGLAELIKQENDLAVCAEVGSVAEAMEAIRLSQPELVIVDLGLPGKGGLELIKDIRAHYSSLFILVISMHDECLYAPRALRAGADGYIMKDASGENLLTAIRHVLNGEGYVSKRMSARILNIFSGRNSNASSSPVERLSDREFEIFELLGRGQDSHQIAKQLSLSSKTVDAHRGNIKKKFRLEGSGELLRYAVRWVESQQFHRLPKPAVSHHLLSDRRPRPSPKGIP